MITRSCSRLICLTVLGLFPLTADAHLLSTGLGPVYDGISHFALSPEEVLPVAALALFAGLRGPPPARHVLFALPTAWLLGGLLVGLGLRLPDLSGQIVTAFIFLLVGGMLVIEAFDIGNLSPRWLRVPQAAAVATAVLMGLIRGNIDVTGFVTGSSTPGDPSPVVLPLLGVALTVFVLTALAASVSLPLKAMWSRIAVCVSGSWSAALGLLLVGWSIHLAAIAQHQIQ